MKTVWKLFIADIEYNYRRMMLVSAGLLVLVYLITSIHTERWKDPGSALGIIILAWTIMNLSRFYSRTTELHRVLPVRQAKVALVRLTYMLYSTIVFVLLMILGMGLATGFRDMSTMPVVAAFICCFFIIINAGSLVATDIAAIMKKGMARSSVLISIGVILYLGYMLTYYFVTGANDTIGGRYVVNFIASIFGDTPTSVIISGYLVIGIGLSFLSLKSYALRRTFFNK